MLGKASSATCLRLGNMGLICAVMRMAFYMQQWQAAQRLHTEWTAGADPIFICVRIGLCAQATMLRSRLAQ